jgi:hypothetical protein
MGRDSPVMVLLRFLQKQYKHFGFLDRIVQPFLPCDGNIALLCLLAPPRSGSTLTYQVLSSAFCGYSLRNVSNFLFATPAIGYLATKKMCRKHESSFCSERGFVSGLCGEAEGLKFWQHWLGQGLDQRPEMLNAKRLRQLKKALDRTGESVMISGYLGHVFAVSALRNVFSKVLFVYLQRDLLSNAYSLLKLMSGLKPFSTCPSSVKEKSYTSRHQLVVDQVRSIRELISCQDGKDMLLITYEDLCDDTHGTLRRIEKKAAELGMPLCRKGPVPKSFLKRVIDREHDAEAANLNEIIEGTV